MTAGSEHLTAVTSPGGRLRVVDVATGTITWSADARRRWPVAPHQASAADGSIHVGTSNGRLMAFAAAGCGQPICQPRWRSTRGAAIQTQPVVAGDLVHVGRASGHLENFAADGCPASPCAPLYRSADLGGRPAVGPVVAGGRIYPGLRSGIVVALGLSSPA